MNFAVVNLGCKVNRVESDAAAAQLLAAGWQAAGTAEADVVVVNTCTVTGEAEKKTRKAVRRALRENARGAVLVTGCAAAIDAPPTRPWTRGCAWFPRRAFPGLPPLRGGARGTRLRGRMRDGCRRPAVPPPRRALPARRCARGRASPRAWG